jgi:hypothetical protein
MNSSEDHEATTPPSSYPLSSTSLLFLCACYGKSWEVGIDPQYTTGISFIRALSRQHHSFRGQLENNFSLIILVYLMYGYVFLVLVTRTFEGQMVSKIIYVFLYSWKVISWKPDLQAENSSIKMECVSQFRDTFKFVSRVFTHCVWEYSLKKEQSTYYQMSY